jgi:hypothetical protein
VNATTKPEPCYCLHQLPLELLDAALNFCVTVHHDNPQAVAVMLDDLRRYPATLWPWLTAYFHARLPTPPPGETEANRTTNPIKPPSETDTHDL